MELQFHPIANLLPLMQDNEFDEFTASIRERGLLDPIILFEGKILDGRNRYRACNIVGIEPRTEEFNRDDPVKFVLDRNIHRRQLTKAQLGLAMAKFARLICGSNQFKPKEGGPSGTTLTVAQAAELAGVKRTTLKRSRLILTYGTPEEIESVRNGTASANRVAYNIAARRAGRPEKIIQPKTQRSRGGQQLKTRVREFQRHIEMLCTSCEHIEDIEVPELENSQVEQTITSLKAARLVLTRLIIRVKNGDHNA